MKITEKKILANRENSKKGGVKTQEGKNVSRFNALKHGVMAKFATEYDDFTFEQIFEMFSEQYQPKTATDSILIEQLTIAYIRLRRCARFESELIREALNPPRYKEIVPDYTQDYLEDPGQPATLDSSLFESLHTVFTRYEPLYLSKFLKLIEVLEQR